MTSKSPFEIKVENILKGSLDSIPSPSPSLKIQEWRPIIFKNIEITEGQLISKGFFGVFKSIKIPTIFLKDFCPRL